MFLVADGSNGNVVYDDQAGKKQERQVRLSLPLVVE